MEEKLRKRKGNRKYELQDRAVLGSSVGDLYGPGTKYQIDATVADVYIVSSMNRNWIIGRPVIYVVIDVFSRMVVGVYVGLEGPSWYGAMMAISNAASDKVSFCKRYGISIEKDEWDCHHLPQALLADRGELEGYNVDRLIQAFNVKVENTPPYRGDWKGIVEQHFRIIHAKVKPFLPGFVDTDVKVRGDRDYRLDATLTLEEFTSVIIRCILHHNNNHWLANYNADEMLIQDDVSLIPRELWNWGIKHRTGKLRSYPEDIVKLHLLPSAHARVTYRGIEFKKMRYSSERSLKENWFGDARERSWR
ncbi:DNA-binding protein, partial [Halobacillus trueperi]